MSIFDRLKNIKNDRHTLYDAIDVPAYNPERERQLRQSMDVMNRLLASPERNAAIAALRDTLRDRARATQG